MLFEAIVNLAQVAGRAVLESKSRIATILIRAPTVDQSDCLSFLKTSTMIGIRV